MLGLGLLAVLLPPARREIRNPGEFFALMLFALTGLLLAAGTNHLLFLFVALELSSLSLYLLAGFPRTARGLRGIAEVFPVRRRVGGLPVVRPEPALRFLAMRRRCRMLAARLVANPRVAAGHRRTRDGGRRTGFQTRRRAVPLLGARCLSGRSRHQRGTRFRRLESGRHGGARALPADRFPRRLRFRGMGRHGRRLVAVDRRAGRRLDDFRQRARPRANQRPAPARLFGGRQHRLPARRRLRERRRPPPEPRCSTW